MLKFPTNTNDIGTNNRLFVRTINERNSQPQRTRVIKTSTNENNKTKQQNNKQIEINSDN